MNTQELNRWVDYHDSLFDGFLVWWQRRAPEAVEAWRDALSLVSLTAAKEASRELLIGDIDAEGGYTSHLKAIRSRAITIMGTRADSSRGPRYSDGREVFDCAICHDSGTVAIWRPEVIADAIAGKTPEPRTALCACSCKEGNRFANPVHGIGAWGKVKLPVYEEGAAYPFMDLAKRTRRDAFIVRAVGETTEEKLRSIMEAAERHSRVENHPNYNPAFAEYSREATP